VHCDQTPPTDLAPNTVVQPCENFGFNQVCTVGCKDGYVGEGTYKCGMDKQWAVLQDPACAPATAHGFFHIEDERAGCPDAQRGKDRLLAKSFTLEEDSVIWLSAQMIRYVAGRTDLMLFVDGKQVSSERLDAGL